MTSLIVEMCASQDSKQQLQILSWLAKYQSFCLKYLSFCLLKEEFLQKNEKKIQGSRR